MSAGRRTARGWRTRASGLCVAALLAVAGAMPARAQLPSPVVAARAPDSTVITVDAFIRRVAAQHPAVRQARLGVDQAREEQRVARGAFDPTVSATWDRKTFGTVAYYDYVAAALTVPTPVGVDVKIGYERAAGRYTSPDRRTPGGGLLTAGLSLPLGQRIVTDERRTAIAVARAIRDGADAERDAAVNRVLVQATRDYARWYEADRRAAVAREGAALAEFRLGAVRRRVASGEAPAMDTVEALLETHRRSVQLVEAEQLAYAARLAAEAHLWDARGLPDTLLAGATPSADQPRQPPPDSATVERWVAAAERAHPDVLRASARVDQASAQRRLAVQQRLPYAAAEVGALGAADDGVSLGTTADDLKLGLVARTPLLFLRERGRANAAALRVEQQEVERARVRREVAIVVRTAASELAAVARAADVQRMAVEQARLLLRGEQLRFEAGESTLFLVNARERALLDEALRLVAIEARALTARSELDAVLGSWSAVSRDER